MKSLLVRGETIVATAFAWHLRTNLENLASKRSHYSQKSGDPVASCLIGAITETIVLLSQKKTALFSQD